MRGSYLKAVIVICLLIGGPVFSGETRTFTNKEGKSIKAEFLESASGHVQIKRISDGRLFVLEIDALSSEDQIWIAEQSDPKPPTDDPDDTWSRLALTLQNPKDSFEVVGRDSGIARIRYGGVTYETHLPKGSWLKLYVLNEFGILEHFVKFEGAKQWKVSSEGARVFLDRDGKGPELIGVTLELDQEMASIPEGIPIASALSVEILSEDQIDTLGELMHPISGVVADGLRLGAAHLEKLAEFNPKALHADLALADIGSLSDFTELEALRLSVQQVELTNKAGEKTTTPPILLPPLPRLQYVSFRVPVAPTDLPEVFAASTPNLRMFDCDVMSRSPQFPRWENLGQLKFLESIHSGWGIEFGAETLATHPALVSLNFGPKGMDLKDPDFDKLETSKNLRELAIRFPKFPTEVVQKCAREGGLAKVRALQTYQDFDFGVMKAAEVLSLQRSNSSGANFDIPSVGKLERLRFLSVHYADQEEVDTIADLPNRDQLEVVLLANGTYDDLSPLAALPNLKRLEISNRSLEEIDLSLFPKLEVFAATRMEKLVQVANLANHPALMDLNLSGSKELTSLGPAAPNKVLRCLSLSACPELRDWDGLSQTTAIKQVYIYNCDGLVDTKPIEQSNLIEYFYVNGCEQLASRGKN